MNPGLLAFLIVTAFFALLVLGIILFKRHSNFFKDKEDKKPEEKQIVQEELNRMLEEVNDEEAKKAMENFEKNKPQNENNKENK